MINVHDSLQKLQTAVNELEKYSGVKTGALQERSVAHFPAKKERDEIKKNLRELEQQIYLIHEVMDETLPASCTKVLEQALTVRESVCGACKIKEYAGKLSLLKRMKAFLSNVFHRSFYVCVGDHIVGRSEIEKKIESIHQKVQSAAKETSGEKSTAEKKITSRNLAEEAAAFKAKDVGAKKVEGAVRKRADEEVRKAEEEILLSFAKLAEKGISRDAKKLQHVLSRPEKPVFWVEENKHTKAVEVKVLHKGQEAAKSYQVKDGKVEIDGVNYKSPKELKDKDFYPLSDVASCRSRVLAEAKEVRVVEKELTDLRSMLVDDMRVCAISKDENENLFLSMPNISSDQIDHIPLDFKTVPGKFVCTLSEPDVSIEMKDFTLPELVRQIELATGNDTFSVAQLQSVKGLSETFVKKLATPSFDEDSFIRAIKNTPDVPKGTCIGSRYNQGKVEVKIFEGMDNGEPQVTTHTLDLLENPGKFTLSDGSQCVTVGALQAKLKFTIGPNELVSGMRLMDTLKKNLLPMPVREDYLTAIFEKNKSDEEFKVWGIIQNEGGYALQVYNRDFTTESLPVVPYFDEEVKAWKVKVFAGDTSVHKSYSSLEEAAKDLGLTGNYNDLVRLGFKGALLVGKAVDAASAGVKWTATSMWSAAKNLTSRALNRLRPSVTEEEGKKIETKPSAPVEEAASVIGVPEEQLAAPEWWLDREFGSYTKDEVGATEDDTAILFFQLVDRWGKDSSSVRKEFKEVPGRYHVLVEGLRIAQTDNDVIRDAPADTFEKAIEYIKNNFSMVEQYQLYELAGSKKNGFRAGATDKMAETIGILWNILASNTDQKQKDELKKYLLANSTYATGFRYQDAYAIVQKELRL